MEVINIFIFRLREVSLCISVDCTDLTVSVWAATIT